MPELLDGLAERFKVEFHAAAGPVHETGDLPWRRYDALLVDASDPAEPDPAERVREALATAGTHMPGVRPIVLVPAGRPRVDRAGLAAGAWDIVGPGTSAEDLDERLGAAARLCRLQRTPVPQPSQESGAEDPAEAGLLGDSAVIRSVHRAIDRVARTEVSVLVSGESGTGKELAAISIHRKSDRAAGPFVPVNCGAIPETLLESELFGCEPGAFTGATRRMGRFRAAEGGTLFLDEVGELASPLQTKLLRFLEDHVVEPVGSVRRIPVDVRIVAATNCDLSAAVETGRFREDLYYRLAVFDLSIPRLAERGDDVLSLAQAFLRRCGCEQGRPGMVLGPDAVEALRRAPWPGNVRELLNRIRRALVVAEGPQLTAVDLGLVEDREPSVCSLRDARQRAEARVIEDGLRRHGWRKQETAEALGISRTRLYELMQRYAIAAQLSA